MMPLRKIAREILIGGLITAGAAAVTIGALIYFLLPRDMEKCENNSYSLPPNRLGDAVEIKEQICDGPAHSYVVSVYLTDHRWHWQRKFFSYEPNDDFKPHIVWTNDRELLVRAGDVSSIGTQREKLGDISIKYEIRKISP